MEGGIPLIIYAANRRMRVLGMASTDLPGGLILFDDLKTEEVDTGTASFEFTVHFTAETRKQAETLFEVGNYILRADGDRNELYTIIDEELDTSEQTIHVYSEDAGLDLLNEIATPFAAPSAQNIQWYVNKYIAGSGFQIGVNTYGGTTMRLTFSNEQTCKERLDEIAEAFGAEISCSFAVKNTMVTNKYINIYSRRGSDKGVQLRLNREVDRIRITKNIENIATGLLCVGGTADGSDIPVNLDGYSYDDGDFYVSGRYLYSRTALAKWARFLPGGGQATDVASHIIQKFQYDTVSQAALCNAAIKELRKLREAEVNYEVDIKVLPVNTRIGDTVYVVDDDAGLYLQSRILKLETSRSNRTIVATLGDYLIRGSGIAQTVANLAARFAEIAAARTLYTWVAYADDAQGTGITTDPAGKEYVGLSANHLEKTPVLTDPSIYTWSLIKGEPGVAGKAGADAITMTILASNGTVFKTRNDSTILTAHIYRGGVEVTEAYESIGTLRWFKDGTYLSGHDGTALLVRSTDISEKAAYEARLESSGVVCAVIATISQMRDIVSAIWYYRLVDPDESVPSKPTTDPPPAGWSTTEPAFDKTSNKLLYVCEKTVFSDETFEYSDVSLSSSYTVAKDAWDHATAAARAAENAQSSASAAATSASNAATSASNAATSAENAAASAESASDSASDARYDAGRANESANSALLQLSNVEDVIGTVNWITEHGTYTLTEDTTVQEGKVYYINEDGLYTIVQQPTDEDLGDYYELTIDQALANYVASHLAMTDQGLFILNDETAYKMLLGATGAQIQDENGVPVVTYGATGTEFSSYKPFYIGNDNAFILFTPATATTEARITIGGSNVDIGGSQTLESLLQRIENLDNGLNGADGTNEKLSNAQQELEDIGSFVKVDTSDPTQPVMTLGSDDSAITARLTNDELGFYAKGNEDPVAYINVDEDTNEGVLHVTNVIAVKEVRFGRWAWHEREGSGNLSVKWIGDNPTQTTQEGGE